MNEDENKNGEAAAKKVIATAESGRAASQPPAKSAQLAGITVTTGTARQNMTSASGSINSIRVGTSGGSIVISQQPLIKKAVAAIAPMRIADVEEEDDGPPILQPQVGSSTAGIQQPAPILAIPQPKPNSVVLVKTPDGRTLLISNKPQTPGGPCTLTYQYVQLPLTGQPTQQPTSMSTPQHVASSQQQRGGANQSGGRIQVTSVNRQPSLIRQAAAAPSVMNDHVYRGTQSPNAQAANQNLYINRNQAGSTAAGSGPGRWLSIQPTHHQRRPLYQSTPGQRRSSWYNNRDDYYDEIEDDVGVGSPYFDEYASGGGAGAGAGGAGGGGDYFMDEDEETGGFRGGNDGPPELEPMGAVPFLRGASNYGGHAFRRARISGGGGGMSYQPRFSGGGSPATTLLFNRRGMEFREKVDRRRIQECKAVLNRVIDEVVETERQRKREEAKTRPKKSRTEYWRQYRLKRKFKRMQDDELNKRADVWCREINKRRDSIRSMVNREIHRHITESAVSKVVNERVRLGWTMPTRPLKRATPVLESPVSNFVLSTPNKRSRYDTAAAGNVNMDYGAAGPSAAAAAAGGGPTTFPFSGAGLYESAVIYGEPGVVEETIVDGVNTYYKPDSQQQQHEEDQRAAEAIMGLAAGAAASSSTASAQQQEDLAFEQQLHCICRQPLDRSKFYVMCDMCGRWFHGKCVGITEKKSRQMSTWSCRDCQKEKERASQELYCICRTPYDETQPYICCDACDGWYHCSCVGVSPAEADALPNFFCPNCLQASQGASSGGAASNVISAT